MREPITITRTELAEMYDTLSIREICKRLGGIGFPQLYRLLDEAGIERKLKRNSVKLIG